MEFVHVLGIVFLVIMIGLFLVRNRGGVKDIGTSGNRELLKHMTIIKDGVAYRPETAEEMREEGLYKVTMHEIQNSGRQGDSMIFALNRHDYTVNLGLSLSPGELVLEQTFSSIAELVDPVLKNRHDYEVLKLLERTEYADMEQQLREAELGERDSKRTISKVRAKLLDYIKLLQKMQKDNSELKSQCATLNGIVDMYGEAPDTYKKLSVAQREIVRLNDELFEIRSRRDSESEAVQKIIGRQPESSGTDVTVVR